MTAPVIPLPPLPVERPCPDCHEPQRWCDTSDCRPAGQQGHWTHLTGPATATCFLLGGTLLDPQRRVTS